MVDLLLAADRRRLRTKGVVLSVYDPCCGSCGMLTIAKEHVTAGETRGGEACAPAVSAGADYATRPRGHGRTERAAGDLGRDWRHRSAPRAA